MEKQYMVFTLIIGILSSSAMLHSAADKPFSNAAIHKWVEELLENRETIPAFASRETLQPYFDGLGSFEKALPIIAHDYYLFMERKNKQKTGKAEEMPAWLKLYFDGVSIQDLFEAGLLDDVDPLDPLLMLKNINDLTGIDNFINARRIVLYLNKIKNIEPGTFAGFNNLEYLSLVGNQIRDIPDGTFSNLPSLKSVHLGKNPISAAARKRIQEKADKGINFYWLGTSAESIK
jgi:hypothetical protein